MHIPVKITTQGSTHACKFCRRMMDPLLMEKTFYFTIELREGIETVGPYCTGCLSNMEMGASIAPPEVPTGPVTPSHAVRRRVRNQERGIAEDMGGRTQPGSGNQSHAKGDVRLKGKYRIEAKLTKSSQYILRLSTLEKIASECAGLERPGLVLDYVDRRTLRSIGRWAVIPYDDFLDFSGKRDPAE